MTDTDAVTNGPAHQAQASLRAFLALEAEPDERSVGVLVGSPFPGRVGVREIHRDV